MIWFDVTKSGSAGHRSGLTRVSARLRDGLGAEATAVRWPEWRGEGVKGGDWFFTAELFSEEERPGWTEFLQRRAGRTAALFHDAIPLKHPAITWPQSVARHPGYMKFLARFDRVWAVSAASREELLSFWRWQGVEPVLPVDVLALGADFDATPRVVEGEKAAGRGRDVLCVGILEPRKNQAFLVDVCEELWSEGLDFKLHVVGRVNPHFGKPVVARVRMTAKKFRGLYYHAAASDAEVAALYARARATVFPTIAEGCGLPLLESLWRGVPCVCSDLPALREHAVGGGCLLVATNDRAGWKTALRRVLTEDDVHGRLRNEAMRRALPTWREAAQTLGRELVG